MSTPWPSTLPQKPLPYDFKEVEPDNIIRQSMDVGPPKLRQRSTSKGETLDLSFVFTTAQKATHKTFYQTTLFFGSLPYEWSHPETGVTSDYVYTTIPEYKFVGSTWVPGTGYISLWQCSFSVLRKV